MKVLLVDDQPSLIEEIIDTLATLGYEAVKVSNSQKALEAIKEDENIKLAFIDFGLDHDNMDGVELSQAVTNIRPNLPVIIYTFNSSNAIAAKKAMSAGIPPQFFVDRNKLKNGVAIQQLIDDAVELSINMPSNNSSDQVIWDFPAVKKVQLCFKNISPREYQFIDRDNILFIKAIDKRCNIYLRDRPTALSISKTAEELGIALQRRFKNIVKLQRGLWINIDQLKSRKGNMIYFDCDHNFSTGIQPAGNNVLKQLGIILFADD